ncbi:DUF998 domain-containing protein [Nocardia stercoris]|uniref:DUF998 domain-containing protein n=1 Tax=Nocardia stercoris TaxID=2483361 RepID=A0A3M2L382_9NOCA|nr:DUF998 domain-containing protein [Nocardia stercoris]RMI31436.1 DUF998 domain-containing protein [Nocardia stercoris]
MPESRAGREVAMPTASFAVARWPRLLSLALALAAAPVGFTAVWMVLGVLSPGYTLFGHHFRHYSAISQPISGLGIGATAPYMNAAFIVTGVLVLAGVPAAFATVDHADHQRRSWSIALLSATGVGMIIDGLFTLAQPIPHLLGFAFGILVPVVAFPVAGGYLREAPRWQRFGRRLRYAGPITLALIILFFLTFRATPDAAEHGISGIVERVLVTEVLACFAALGWHATRTAVDPDTEETRQ